MTTGSENERQFRERRRGLSQEELEYVVKRIVELCGDRIAEVAAEKTVEKLYIAVGKAAVRRFAWFLGAATIAILAFLAKKHIELK